MTTFDPHGMVTRFKVDRPLSKNEQQHRFKVKQCTGAKPHYQLSLIKLNSTFVECVDKWYSMRGFVAMGGILFCFLTVALLYITLDVLIKSRFIEAELMVVLVVLVVSLLLLCGATIHLLTRDAFTYTHYPIRFNRKNRQVYVFRRDGTVLKAGWDDIYWTIYGHDSSTRDAFIAGHVMGDDKKTVKETVALSVVTVAIPVGEEKLRNHFEFFRRYMEEGPGPVLDAIKPVPLIMLPAIYKQREGLAFGWERLTLAFNGFALLQLVFQVFFVPMSLFRWFAMRTSKIPQWPHWVEDECQVDPDDMWIRDERHAAQ